MKDQLKELCKALAAAGYKTVKVIPGAKDGTIDINLAPVTVKKGQTSHPAVAELGKCKLASASIRVFQACPSDLLIIEDVYSPAQRAAEKNKNPETGNLKPE